MFEDIIIFSIALIVLFIFEDNFEIKLNTDLFLDLKITKNNQKKLYKVLKERFENEIK